MSEMKELLASVAREARASLFGPGILSGGTFSGGKTLENRPSEQRLKDEAKLLAVLERRLLPLLEAGQAMREEIVEASDTHEDRDVGQCVLCLATRAWDAALAALERTSKGESQ